MKNFNQQGSKLSDSKRKNMHELPSTSLHILGSYQGKFQKDGMLGHLDDFINSSLPPVTLYVGRHTKQPRVEWQITNTMRTSCGSWVRNKFVSRLLKQIPAPNQNMKKVNRSGALIFYGDSMQVRFYKSLVYKSLCKKVFSQCKLVYVWNYKHFPGEDIFGIAGKPFNRSQFLAEMRSSLTDRRMRNAHSLFLVNFGLHTIMTLSFEEAKDLFRHFLATVDAVRKENGGKDFGRIVWKNTTPPHVEHSKKINVTHTRFLTKKVSFVIVR